MPAVVFLAHHIIPLHRSWVFFYTFRLTLRLRSCTMAKKDLNLFGYGLVNRASLVSYWLLGLICVAPRALEMANHVQLVFFDRLYAN